MIWELNWMHILFMCEIYIILSLSANLVSGYSGLLSFANAAFYGIGAYVTAIFMKSLGWNFFLAMIAAICVNMVFSLIISYFATRMRDLYFTLATIALQIIVFNVLYNWEKVTSGSFGIGQIPEASVGSFVFDGSGGNPFFNGSSGYTFLGALLAGLVIFFFFFIQKTPFLRVLEGIRDQELGAMSLGKNVHYYKFVCNAISAAFMSIAGGLYAVYNSYIDPTSFTLNESILIVNMILIGGTGNLAGPIFGAVFYVLVPEFIRKIPIESTQGACLQLMLFSVILILVIRFRPNGIFGKFKFQ